MAGRNRGRVPPPPPLFGQVAAPEIIAIDDQDMHQVPPMNNPQQNIPRGRDAPNIQRPAYRPGPNYNPNMIINNSIRVSDITPRKELSADYCRKELTTYEVHTIQQARPIESTNEKAAKKDRRRSSISTKDTKDSTKGKTTWDRVTTTRENFSREDIIKKIKRLDKRQPVTDRKDKLKQNQRHQITLLLDEVSNSDREPQWFTWTLAQLHRRETRNSKGERETATITVFFKRSPRPEVDVIAMFRSRRPQPHVVQPFPPFANGPQQGVPMNPVPLGNMGVNEGRSRSASQGAPLKYPGKEPAKVEIVHEKKGGKKPGAREKYRSDSSTSSRSSDSESESDSMYGSDTTPSSPGSSSRKARRWPDVPRRRHDPEPGYLLVEKPRRRTVTYVPEVPRYSHDRAYSDSHPSVGAPAAGSAVAEAFAAGLMAANRVSTSFSSPSPTSMSRHLDDRDYFERRDDEERRRRSVEDMIRRESAASPRHIDIEDIWDRRDMRRPSEFLRRGSSAVLDDYEVVRNPMSPIDRPMFRYTDRLPRSP